MDQCNVALVVDGISLPLCSGEARALLHLVNVETQQPTMITTDNIV